MLLTVNSFTSFHVIEPEEVGMYKKKFVFLFNCLGNNRIKYFVLLEYRSELRIRFNNLFRFLIRIWTIIHLLFMFAYKVDQEEVIFLVISYWVLLFQIKLSRNRIFDDKSTIIIFNLFHQFFFQFLIFRSWLYDILCGYCFSWRRNFT